MPKKAVEGQPSTAFSSLGVKLNSDHQSWGSRRTICEARWKERLKDTMYVIYGWLPTVHDGSTSRKGIQCGPIIDLRRLSRVGLSVGKNLCDDYPCQLFNRPCFKQQTERQGNAVDLQYP